MKSFKQIIAASALSIALTSAVALAGDTPCGVLSVSKPTGHNATVAPKSPVFNGLTNALYNSLNYILSVI